MIDAIAATHPDAFIVVPGDPVGPYQALKTGFFDKKIPIVLTNSILTPNDIVTSTIRSDNQYGGSLAATAMLGLIGNKGKVVTISYIPGNPDTEGRRLGFENGVKAQSGVTDLGVQYGNDDPAKVAGIVSAILTTNPDIAGIFAVDNGTAGAVSTALAAAGKTGTVKLVTFDADSKQAQDLQNGVIQALIAQQPYAEGYIAVQQALYALTGQPTAPSIGTGFTVITKDNLAANQKAIYQDSCS
jgi:ribose transport system substrate-binding protein